MRKLIIRWRDWTLCFENIPPDEVAEVIARIARVFGARRKTRKITCKWCGSENVIKKGFRYNKSGKVQVYKCKDCGRKFTMREDPFHKMKHRPEVIMASLDLYRKGLSLRKIADHLKQFYGVEVSHVAIYYWINKYLKAMKGRNNPLRGR